MKKQIIQEYCDRSPLFQLAQSKLCPSRPQEPNAHTKILAKLDTLGSNYPPPKWGRQHPHPQSRINKPSKHKFRACYYHRTYRNDAKMPARMHLSEGRQNQPTGKLQRQSVTDLSNLSSHLLYVTERNSKLKFFINTGSEVSVIPRSTEEHFLHPTDLYLQAANKKPEIAFTDKVPHIRLWTSP